jgi:hypothetical protein
MPALKGQHQFRRRRRRALVRVDRRQHVVDRPHTSLHRLARAADLLDREGAEGRVFLDAVGFHPAWNLEDLAAEAHHQHATNIGIGRKAPLRLLQEVIGLAVDVETAARAVHERNDAVDVREIREHAGLVDLFSNEAGRTCRTVHRGQHRDVVACADLSIGAAIAEEGGALALRQKRRLLQSLAEHVVPLESVNIDIVLVHPVAGRDHLLGEADDLTVFDDRLVLFDRYDRHLVAARNAHVRSHRPGKVTGIERIRHEGDVVGGGKLDEAGHGMLDVRCAGAPSDEGAHDI